MSIITNPYYGMLNRDELNEQFPAGNNYVALAQASLPYLKKLVNQVTEDANKDLGQDNISTKILQASIKKFKEVVTRMNAFTERFSEREYAEGATVYNEARELVSTVLEKAEKVLKSREENPEACLKKWIAREPKGTMEFEMDTFEAK